MSIAVRDLAAAVAGAVVGDATRLLAGAATLETAGTDEIALVDAADKLHLLARSRAGAAVVPRGTGPLDRPTIEVDDVHAAFAAVILRFRPARPRTRCGVSPQAVVDPSARLAADVEVHPLAVIGADCVIGPGSTIHSGARLAAGCTVGAGSEIFPNAVLGA